MLFACQSKRTPQIPLIINEKLFAKLSLCLLSVEQEGRGKVLWVYAKHLRNSASQIYSAKICESPGHQANEIRFYGSTSVVVKHLASSRFATKSQRRSYAASSSCGTVCYNSTCVAISFAIRLYSC
jgi:hypothetical protein